ncbi:MAG TPA: hypothetical protein VD948_04350 [Rhodothermales bacterium]|nr:hypothetical protein [Rhodothermales bacterium]
MSNRQDLITKHIADATALEKHILEAIERQREDATVKNSVDANRVVIEIERVLNQHLSALSSLAQQYGGEGESVLKSVVTSALGVAAGLYDKIRESELTRMLRDDYTALSLDAMGYTAMHAFALGIGEQPMADLASRHLNDLTPLLLELSRLIPQTTITDLAKEHPDLAVNTSKISEAVETTQRAWTREAMTTGGLT